jgi:hypothetical protein
MTKSMDTWFFMRPGFNTFKLEPQRHKRFLFGKRDRRQRDLLLGTLEEAGYSQDGHKAAVFGDYGRGKTHQCHNIISEIDRRGMGVVPVYVKCSAYKTKESFDSLFREMIAGLTSAELHRVATEYQQRVLTGNATPLKEVVPTEDIAFVLSEGLTAVNPKLVKNSMRWLGGEAKVNMEGVNDALKPQLTDSRDFGAVMRGLSHIYVTVDGKVPLYLVDEAERLQNITNPDSYYTWLASIRELTEISGVGILFLIGARTRNELPTIFVQDEIIRRIGVSNYIEFTDPSENEIEEFLLELFQTFVQKGPVPEPHESLVDSAALSTHIPAELQNITGGEDANLRTYPFEPAAFDEFVKQLTRGDRTSRPSEVLSRLQKAAQRAMRFDCRTINSRIVSEIESEGF